MQHHGADRCNASSKHGPLAAILLLAAMLRLWQIGESLWLDELHTAWVVSGAAGQIAERARIGNQSPLYFVLPWLTTSALGMHEWSLRLPSLLAGLGLVAAAYGLAFRFSASLIAAYTVALLVSVDRNCLFFATEARPYALVQLVAVAQLLAFWESWQQPSRAWRMAFVGLTTALFYLHYTAILLVAGPIVFVTASCFVGLPGASGSESALPWRSHRVRSLLVDLVAIALLILPAAKHLVEIGSRRSSWGLFVNQTSWLLPIDWFALDSYVAVPLGMWLTAALALAGPGRVGFADCNWRPAVLLVGWFLTPLVVVWTMTVTGLAPLYLGRYLIGAACGPILFAGLCAAGVRGRWARAGIAVVIVTYAVYAGGLVEQLREDGRLLSDRRQDWRAAVAFVNTQARTDLPVFVRSGLLEADRLREGHDPLLRACCLSPVTSIYRLQQPADNLIPLPTTGSGDLSDKQTAAIARASGAWFVINAPERSQELIRTRVLDALRTTHRSWTVLDARSFGDVAVWRVQPVN